MLGLGGGVAGEALITASHVDAALQAPRLEGRNAAFNRRTEEKKQ